MVVIFIKNNKATIPIVTEIFKNENIEERKIIMEELFLEVIKKSEANHISQSNNEAV